jgi:hypothetical protein
MTTPEPVIHLAISPRTAEALRRRLDAPKTCAEYDSGDTELLELVSAELAAQLGGLPPESPTPVAKPRALDDRRADGRCWYRGREGGGMSGPRSSWAGPITFGVSRSA